MSSPVRQNRQSPTKRTRANRPKKVPKSVRSSQSSNRPPKKLEPERSSPAGKKETPTFTTPNLANVISSFYTIRSTVQQLSDSLQRMEKIMSNAYQMFEIANTFMGRRNAPGLFGGPRRRPRLRLIKPPEEDGEIPRLNLPDELPRGGGGSFGISQIFKLIQSPIVQQLLSGMAKTSEQESKQKQG
ncbi:hypothetical protein SAMN05444487_104190 [Marininema mesophilum]|uniref:YqfQ-like protein n=1 Tax=Marininema mesophilum TaxID=1048340 RepID=A0A1H2USN2_9BACL|nr:hypothetical protein [Marininema mesophilum]SDW58574.1 hypothetical protein SAMN05444487_104190 [Marininema mesophilum]